MQDVQLVWKCGSQTWWIRLFDNLRGSISLVVCLVSKQIKSNTNLPENELNHTKQEEAADTSQRISFVRHHVEKPIKMQLKNITT